MYRFIKMPELFLAKSEHQVIMPDKQPITIGAATNYGILVFAQNDRLAHKILICACRACRIFRSGCRAFYQLNLYWLHVII